MHIVDRFRNFFYPNPETVLGPISKELSDAWCATGVSDSFLSTHFEYADALYKGQCITPMLMTRDLPNVNNPGLFVNGVFESWTAVLERFSLEKCDKTKDPLERELIFREKVTGKDFFYFQDAEKPGLRLLDQRLLEKWTAAEFSSNREKQRAVAFDLDILKQFPDFAQMLRNTRLLDQMRAMGAKPEWIHSERGREPAILINGQMMGWQEIQRSFTWPSWDEIKNDRLKYSQVQTPMEEKDHYLRINVLLNRDNQTCFYYGNGRGLQVHEAVDWKQMPSVVTLNDEELLQVQSVAQQFAHKDRNGNVRTNTNRFNVIQIVSSREKESSFAFNDTTSNPSHPYINIISGQNLSCSQQTLLKGHVYQVGFWGARVPDGLVKLEGRFYSYDPHSLRPYGERVVTSMAVSDEELRAVLVKIFEKKDWRASTEQVPPALAPKHRFEALGVDINAAMGNFLNGEADQRIPFHVTRQNCSSFVQMVCHEADIEMHASVTVFRLIGESFPPVIRKIGICIYQWSCTAAGVIAPLARRIIPEPIRDWLCAAIALVWDTSIWLLSALFIATLGKGVLLPAGDKLLSLDATVCLEDRKAPWYMPTILWRYLHYDIIHPIGIRDFQKSANTTHILSRPSTIKETVIPPLEGGASVNTLRRQDSHPTALPQKKVS